MTVESKGKYAAGKTYTLDDVVRLCKEVESGKFKLEWLDPINPKHDPKVHVFRNQL